MLFSAALSIDQTSLALLSLTRKFIRLQADKIKKLFFFFYPHTLTFRLKRPVYRGFGGEGWCEGRIFTLTLAITAAEHCFFFLHSNRLAALRSVSLRLQSLNQKTLTDITDATESFTRIRFLISVLILIVPCRTIGILDGFCKWAALAFLRTIYVCKTIAYHMIIYISAAASGNACKSV